MSETPPNSSSEDSEPLGPLAAPNAADGSAEPLDMGAPEAESPTPALANPRLLLIGGLAAATLVGVGIGLTAPGLLRPKAPDAAPAAPETASKGVAIEVATVHTEPAPPTAATPMPTVPPGAPDVAPAQARPAPPRLPEPEAPEPAPERDFIADLADQRAGDLEPADIACAYAAADPNSGCSDLDLIEADMELAEAYRAAQRAGVSPRVLRQDAQDWRRVSRNAANRSRAALLDAYRARADDIWAMAEDADRGGRFGWR